MISRRAGWISLWAAACAACLSPVRGQGADPGRAEAVGTAPAEEGPAPPRRLELSTSDGVDLAAWHYPAWNDPDDAVEVKPATVILVHDLLGSHESVQPLALALQGKGFTVLAPDLRGHGESRAGSSNAPGRKGDAAAALLRKADLEAVAASAGGRVRDQATDSGELETLRAWIKTRAEAGELDLNRLCVIGSGLGATLATLWTANDWLWGDMPLASGAQGRNVRALVLVSPIWASKGVTISPALNAAGVKDSIPILVVGGSADRDAVRLFEQLRRSRPAGWFEQRAEGDSRSSPELANPADASLFLIQFKSSLSADGLLADPMAAAADRIAGFLTLALSRNPR